MTAPLTSSTARDEILRAVRAALPPAVDAPSAQYPRDQQGASKDELVVRFTHAAVASGAQVVACNGDPAPEASRLAAGAREVVSLVPGVVSTIVAPSDPHSLATLDLFLCQAEVGVAENGALWFATPDPIHRAALYLAERVVIVIAANAIVADLHDAYSRVNVRATSFGTFVAGPSKTADIEQALVIGAHGPKELTVIISGT